MSRIELPKIVPYAYLAAPVDAVTIPKIVVYAWVMPGESGGGGPPNRQAHVYAQKVAR